MATASLKVLIVDDDALDRVMFRRYLSAAADASYESAEEGAGEAGLSRCERFSPDCIVLDLNLPDMNGLEFLERLRGNGHTCAVVVATGSGSEQIAVHAIQAGATDYLVKGALTAEGFRHAIDGAVERQRLVCQLEEHRRQLEQRNRELEQSESRFRTLTEAMPQIVWTATSPGVFAYVNRGWREFTGAETGSALGGGWVAFVQEPDGGLILDRWHEAAASARAFDVECRLKAADGSYRRHLMRGVPFQICSAGGATWLGTLTDVEDQKRAEQAMYQRQKLESIGLLAGGVAHDFNNLLVNILGGISFARELLAPGHRARPMLEGAVRASERAADLTRQLLAYAGKGSLVVEPVDLSELVASSFELIRVSVPKKIQLTLETRRRLPSVECDRSQLQQVIMNLVINAAEAIGDQAGLITIRTAVKKVAAGFCGATGEVPPGSYVVLEVTDTGCGMHEEIRTRIFEPFYSTKFTGRGLGLAAVHGIVLGNHGTIDVISSPGKGAAFRVLLPASAAAPRVHAAHPSHARSKRAAGRVLVVDDENMVREMAREMLERAGYDVSVASCGAEAVRIAKAGPELAAILLDMSMPDLSGEETLSRLRAAGVACPVVVSSGYSEAEMARRFNGEQVAAFLPKPYTSQTLLEAVSGALVHR